MLRKLLLGALLLGLAGAASAGFSYTYLEGSYTRLEPDDYDDYLDGFSVGASSAMTRNLFLEAHVEQVAESDFNVDSWRVGFGAHGALGARADLVGGLAYITQNFKDDFFGGGGGFFVDGYQVSAGVRAAPLRGFNLEAFYRRNEYSIYDDTENNYAVSAVIRLVPAIWLLLGYNHSDNTLDSGETAGTWNAGFRIPLGVTASKPAARKP